MSNLMHRVDCRGCSILQMMHKMSSSQTCDGLCYSSLRHFLQRNAQEVPGTLLEGEIWERYDCDCFEGTTTAAVGLSERSLDVLKGWGWAVLSTKGHRRPRRRHARRPFPRRKVSDLQMQERIKELEAGCFGKSLTTHRTLYGGEGW